MTMYVSGNPKSKKMIQDALKANQNPGFPPRIKEFTVFNPGPIGGDPPRDGVVAVCGPHYPAPHKWYAEATLKDGVIVKLK